MLVFLYPSKVFDTKIWHVFPSIFIVSNTLQCSSKLSSMILLIKFILIFKTSQEADFNERKPLDNRQTKEINEGMTEDNLEPSISETSENKSHNETVRSL